MEKQAENSQLCHLRRNDLIVASVMWLISLLTFIESMRLTFNIELPGVADNAWIVAPGLLPLFLSGMLLILLSSLIWTSSREGEFRGHFSKASIWHKLSNREFIVKLLQVLLLGLYVFVGLGNIHFSIATGLYLVAAMTLSQAAKFYQIVIISVLFSVCIGYLFGSILKIPLP